MDQTSQIIENFESILMNNAKRKPLALYSSREAKLIPTVSSISAQDVILNVNQQIKTIQRADMASACKQNIEKMRAFKHCMLPVNMLPRATEVTNPKSTDNFETQFASDSQLIYLIKSADAMVHKTNNENVITLKYETTFSHTLSKKKKSINNTDNSSDTCKALNENSKENASYKSSAMSGSSRNYPKSPNYGLNIIPIHQKKTNPNLNKHEKGKEFHAATHVVTQDNTQLNEYDSEFLKKFIEIDTNTLDAGRLNRNLAILNEDISPSPILQAIKSRTPSPLVFDLGTFENFVKLALPVIEKHTCSDVAKQMINSQIIGEELHIDPEFETSVSDTPLSPVLKMNTERIKIAKKHPEILNNFDKNKEDTKAHEDAFLEDEILFSSDEENEYVQTGFEDMPLTCALETSFYEQPGMLDKTMYVGFQTASNRSIQVSTESFNKANRVLDEVEKDIASSTSLAQLVDSLTTKKRNLKNNFTSCDKGEKSSNISEKELHVSKENISNTAEKPHTGNNDFIEKEIEVIKRLEKRKFDGFIMASKKKIKLTDMALARCKKVFQNIDFEANCDLNDNNVAEDTQLSEIPLRQTNTLCEARNNEVKKFTTMNTTEIKTDETGNVSNNLDEDMLQEFLHDMSLKDEKEQERNRKLVSFKTASEKYIKITEAALARTKHIFDDLGLDMGDDLDKTEPNNESASTIRASKCDANLSIDFVIQKNESKSKFISFKTASNKDIKISAKALANTKNIFQNIDNGTDYDEQETSNVKSTASNQPLSTKQVFHGFKTTSNEEIKITGDAFLKSEDIFKEIIEVNQSNITEYLSNTRKEEIGNQINNYQISKRAQLNSKDVFHEIKVKYSTSSKTYCKMKEEISKELTDFKGMNDELCEDLSSAFENEIQFIEKENYSDIYSFKPVSYKTVRIHDKSSVEVQKDLKEPNDEMSSNKENIVNTVLLKESKVENCITQNKALGSLQIHVAGNNKTDLLSFKTKEFSLIHNSQNTKTCHDKKDKEIIPFKGFQITDDETIKQSEEVKQYYTVNVNDGFRTANNEPETVSSDALIKLKDIDCYNSRNPDDQTPFMGFQTASNKTIKVSSEALAKSKAFEDIENIDGVAGISNQSRDSKIKYTGFQIANNNLVHVSADAFAKSKAILEEVEPEAIEVKMKDRLSKIAGSEYTYRPTEISAKDSATIKRTQAIFMAMDNSGCSKFEGFQTASNNAIKISSEALAKSKALFQDMDKAIYGKKSDLKFDYTSEIGFTGFHTANDKPVEVTAEALVKSKAIFEDVEAETLNTIFPNTHENVLEFDSCKSVPAKTLAEMKVLVDKSEDSPKKNRIQLESTFKGFQTASNKSVQISKEALLKSKKILEDFDQFDEHDMVVSKISKTNHFNGFQTASNKKVSISEDALKKTQHIFQDVDMENCKDNFKQNNADCINKTGNIKSNVKKPFSFGFETGTDDAIKKQSKKLLTDLDANTETEGKLKLLLRDEKQNRIISKENNLEKLIDTQVLHNFEETLCTEDFCKDTPKKSKRSGSPILSCPRAKRSKKFETPYRNDRKSSFIKTNKEDLSKKDSKPSYNKVYKQNKIYKLRDLAEIEKKSNKIDIDSNISKFKSENLLDFEFSGLRNDLNEDILTIDDVKNCFLKGVNKKLIPGGWLEIHLKLIIWKLLSYEIKFPHSLSLACTVNNVLKQLKYRFDKELYNAERPCLRKILEKDDSASRTMILCVAGIFVDGTSVQRVSDMSSNVELLLTDGWYNIIASIDKMLTKLVYDEKIIFGCKIVTNGAELKNCEQGIAPWEDTSSVRLKIFGNSTRLAKWDARLGFHPSAAILSRLTSVKPEGGKVSKMRLFVARVYPMLYVEKLGDGSTVIRSERLEHNHQVKYESERQMAMEKLYEEVEKELSDQDSQDSLLKNSSMTADSMISESQMKALEEKSNRKRERLLQNVQERVRKKIEEKGLSVGRNVVSLMKVRIAGIVEGEEVEVTKGLMSIWKPNDILNEIIKENAWIEVRNVVPTAVRYSEIHLSAGRQSVFSSSKYQESDRLKPYTTALQRKCYTIKDLAQNPTMTSDYNEIDTVGVIFEIDAETNQPFQNIYLSDDQKNMICINFWGGLKKFGFQNLLEVGHVIYGTNLQRRAGNTRKSIPQFRVTEFTYFTKTPKNSNARSIIEEIGKKLSSLNKMQYIRECVTCKNNFSRKTENFSPYRFNNEHNLTKNKIFIDSPLAAKNEINFNLTGLDFESTFKQTDTQDLSPQALERKRKVNAKIAKLKMIGEPPALSPIKIINKSKKAFNSYRSPLALNSAKKMCQNGIESSPVAESNHVPIKPSYQSVMNVKPTCSESDIIQSSPVIKTNVATAQKSYQNSRIRSDDILQSSPVFSLNRTYVKNVNPVKLNFSSVQDNSIDDVDHFAEEFDGSPPLSLD